METAIDKKGRVVIPLDIRKELALKFGQKLKVNREGEEIVLTPQVDKKKFISELRGCVSTRFDVRRLKEIWGAEHAHD